MYASCIINMGVVRSTRHMRACKASTHHRLSRTPTSWFGKGVAGEIWGETCMTHESVSGTKACLHH